MEQTEVRPLIGMYWGILGNAGVYEVHKGIRICIEGLGYWQGTSPSCNQVKRYNLSYILLQRARACPNVPRLPNRGMLGIAYMV